MKNLMCAIGAMGALTASAGAVIIAPGTYPLANHPDGNQQPPRYGLRLDEMYDATPDFDVFTFDFDAPGSNMRLTYADDGVTKTIRIFGTTFGGRDIGGGYAADVYQGFYTVDFLYNIGVEEVPTDDDLWVNALANSNFGSITTPLGHTKILSDVPDGPPPTFQLGDLYDDTGYRGYDGISGWGWLAVDGDDSHFKDWLFTVVPTPGPLVVLGAGALALGRRRR